VDRSRILILLWFVTLVAALGTGRDLLYNLFYLLTILLVVAYLWAWSGTRWMRVVRYTRTGRSQVGKMAEERLTITNTSPIPKLWIEVRDSSTLPDHRVSQVLSPLGSGRSRSWTIKTLCQRRGRYTLGPLSLHSGDPFGLFTSERQLEEPGPRSFIVYPATVDLPGFTPPIGFLPGGDALRRRTHYVTTNVAGVRDYAPGDSFNRIHWPSSARANLERDVQIEPIWANLEEPATPILPWEREPGLTLAPSTVEYGITATASLARHFITRDRAVGLVAYSDQREVIPADRGERQLTKILETLAVISAGGRIPMAEIIAAEGAHLGRNTTVVVITPSPFPHWVAPVRDLERRGLKVIAVVLEPRSFGAREGHEPLLAELIASGIVTYRIQEGDDLAVALGQAYHLQPTTIIPEGEASPSAR
jgi:uncharacterized protein (DUF58 family)